MSEVQTNEYEVRDTLLTGLGIFSDDGQEIGKKDAREGEILTDADLRGRDVERLLRLGSIALVKEPAQVLRIVGDGKDGELTEREVLEAMTKATLAGIAETEGIAIKGLNKAAIVAAIIEDRAQKARAAQDAAAESEGDSEPGEQGATPVGQLSQLSDEDLAKVAQAAGVETDGVERETIIDSVIAAWDQAAQDAAAESRE